jgi:methylglutaconyl-CoA hydratase
VTKSSGNSEPKYQTLSCEVAGAVKTITLNRPDRRNAISGEMIEDLLSTLAHAEANHEVRIVILTGAGKSFCAGMDLETLQSVAGQTPAENLGDSRQMARLFQRVYSFSKPVISAVNGAAIAGGCGLATFADITIAVPEAKFGYTEVKIGFIPALVSVILRRQVGEKRARELALTGRIFDAAEAFRLGLVTEIVPAEKLMQRAHEVAASFLESSPSSLLHTKQLLLHYDEGDVQREIELAIQANADIRSTDDFKEGVTSFLEKRAPKWTAR